MHVASLQLLKGCLVILGLLSCLPAANSAATTGTVRSDVIAISALLPQLSGGLSSKKQLQIAEEPCGHANCGTPPDTDAAQRTQPDCNWPAISCSSWKIVDLNVGCSYEGSKLPSSPFPAGITQLSSLQKLNLGCNRFFGTLPAVSLISKLRSLDLQQNNFNGSLPASWSSATRLTYLDVSQNILTGTLPRTWSSLVNLDTLDVGKNSLNGPIPESWGPLANTVIYVSGNCELCGTPLVKLQLYSDGTHLGSACGTFGNECSPKIKMSFLLIIVGLVVVIVLVIGMFIRHFARRGLLPRWMTCCMGLGHVWSRRGPLISGGARAWEPRYYDAGLHPGYTANGGGPQMTTLLPTLVIHSDGTASWQQLWPPPQPEAVQGLVQPPLQQMGAPQHLHQQQGQPVWLLPPAQQQAAGVAAGMPAAMNPPVPPPPLYVLGSEQTSAVIAGAGATQGPAAEPLNSSSGNLNSLPVLANQAGPIMPIPHHQLYGHLVNWALYSRPLPPIIVQPDGRTVCIGRLLYDGVSDESLATAAATGDREDGLGPRRLSKRRSQRSDRSALATAQSAAAATAVIPSTTGTPAAGAAAALPTTDTAGVTMTAAPAADFVAGGVGPGGDVELGLLRPSADPSAAV